MLFKSFGGDVKEGAVKLPENRGYREIKPERKADFQKNRSTWDKIFGAETTSSPKENQGDYPKKGKEKIEIPPARTEELPEPRSMKPVDIKPSPGFKEKLPTEISRVQQDTPQNGEKGADDGKQAEIFPEAQNASGDTAKTGEASSPTKGLSEERKQDVADEAAQGYNENKTSGRVETIDGVKHYYDDNGKLYRIENDLQPNCEYEINGYKYQTDDKGRVQSAEGTLHLKDRKGRLPIRDSIEDIGKGDQKEGDDRGHLIGDQFDGSNGLENMVPQDADINKKDFRNFENELAAEVKSGKEVQVKVEPVYEGDSRRPSAIVVTYRINGEEGVRVFPNGKGTDA